MGNHTKINRKEQACKRDLLYLMDSIVQSQEFWTVNYYLRSMKKAPHGDVVTVSYPNIFLKYYSFQPRTLICHVPEEIPIFMQEIVEYALTVFYECDSVDYEELLQYCFAEDNWYLGFRLLHVKPEYEETNAQQHGLLLWSILGSRKRITDYSDIEPKYALYALILVLVAEKAVHICNVEEIERHEKLRDPHNKYGLSALSDSDVKFLMEKILVLEDDLALSAGLCFELDSAGYLTVAAYNCQKARQLLSGERFDLALLDVNLPDGNGFDLCREFKARQPELPVIFLTANDLEADVLRGFDMGAEDYVTKPFNMQILLRRVEVALRRVGGAPAAPQADRWSDGWLTLDFSALTAVRGTEKLAITPNEYKLLKYLTEHAGQILTRQQLLDRLWDSGGNFIDDHTLTVTMNRLRAKIEDDSHTYIKTVRGMGYIWTGGKV